MAANSGQSPLSASPARHAPYASTATGAARASDVPGPSQQQQGPSQPFGLDVWLEERKQWRAPNASAKAPKRDPVIAPTVTYEDLLLTSEAFAEPIPLPEMVEFLVDAWIQDGYFD